MTASRYHRRVSLRSRLDRCQGQVSLSEVATRGGCHEEKEERLFPGTEGVLYSSMIQDSCLWFAFVDCGLWIVDCRLWIVDRALCVFG